MAASPIDPNIIFSVGHGYWNSKYWLMFTRTTDRGATWYCDTLDSLFRGNAFCYDLSDRNKVYLAGDTYYSSPMFRVSTDLGQTWTERRSGLAGSIVTIAAVPRSPGMLFCGSGNGLYKTTDEGLSWTRKGSFVNVRSIAVDTVSPHVVYAATASGVYASTDGGENWSTMNSGLPTNDVLTLALRSGPLGALYCGTNGRGVYVTSPLVSVSEAAGEPAGRRKLPTLCGRVLFIPDIGTGTRYRLLDAAGRVRTALTAGRNDVSRLSAGVYFICEEERGPEAAFGKVVIR